MTVHRDKWWASMIAKHGSREAVMEHQRLAQKKSMLNPKRAKGVHKGGYSYKSKEELREIGRKGAAKRWGKAEA